MSNTAGFIAVRIALKRLRSPDYQQFDVPMRRVAWDSVMSSGTSKQMREANEARDSYPFAATQPTNTLLH